MHVKLITYCITASQHADFCSNSNWRAYLEGPALSWGVSSDLIPIFMQLNYLLLVFLKVSLTLGSGREVIDAHRIPR